MAHERARRGLRPVDGAAQRQPGGGLGNDADSDGARRLGFWQERYFVQVLAGQDVTRAGAGRIWRGAGESAAHRREAARAGRSACRKQGWTPSSRIYFHDEAVIQQKLDLGGENILGLGPRPTGALAGYTLDGQAYQAAAGGISAGRAGGRVPERAAECGAGRAAGIRGEGWAAWGRYLARKAADGVVELLAEALNPMTVEALAARAAGLAAAVLRGGGGFAVRRAARAAGFPAGGCLLPLQPALGAGRDDRRARLDPAPGAGAGDAGGHPAARAGLVRLDLPDGHAGGMGQPARRAAAREADSRRAGGLAKQALLVAILAAALLGSLSLLVFDPLALFTRGMSDGGDPGAGPGSQRAGEACSTRCAGCARWWTGWRPRCAGRCCRRNGRCSTAACGSRCCWRASWR